MPAKITRDTFEAYVKCKYKAHLQLGGQHGIPSEYELMLAEERHKTRLAARERIIAMEDDGGKVLRSVSLSVALLRMRRRFILDALYEDDTFSLLFDGLQRLDGASNLGNFHYAPILFHDGDLARQGQRVILELLGLVLANIQGKAPQWGILFGGRRSELRRVKLGKDTTQAQRGLQQIRDMRGTISPRMRLNPHCQICEFRERCHAEAVQRDDLSLLSGMGENEVSKFNRRGISTVTQLSCTFRARKKYSKQKQQQQPHQHALQALAIREKKTYILGKPALPDSAHRVFFDLEGDPSRGFDYLLGMIVDQDGVENRHSFWVDARDDETRLFHQFIEVVSRVGACQLYCYGSYEASFLRRMAQRLGQKELVESILARTLNVLSIVYSHIYFPTYSNGLKDIGRYLGFRWTDTDASGIQSIVWRRRWEETGSPALMAKLINYNLDDCSALRRVTDFLYAISPRDQEPLSRTEIPDQENHQVCRVEEMDPQSTRRTWCCPNFAIPDYRFVNERAYFDYQQNKVFIRTNRSLARRRAKEIARTGRKSLRANRTTTLVCSQCPLCKRYKIARTADGRLARLALDLRITRSGARRHVTRYTTFWHHCAHCKTKFLPQEYLRLEEHCHALKSWAMYEHVAHRSSFSGIADRLHDLFGLPIVDADVCEWQSTMSRDYEATYRRLVEKIVAGKVIHADETEVRLKRTGKGYVWVFASLEEVVFMYRKSREGAFLSGLLSGFRGVLVSDFYAAYDSIECDQQKCLIHLMRDFNEDLLANPWDEELKALATQFGVLLRTIVGTVDLYGLKRHHLGKHNRDVDRFYAVLSEQIYRSELTEGYRKRLIRHRRKLFTFLNHDGIPWNNNNAEHAIKRFAKYRASADGRYSEAGLGQYLLLLSICATCKLKRLSFLNFLLSGEQDIDTFDQMRRKGSTASVPRVEVHPDGLKLRRPSRRQTWDRNHGNTGWRLS